MSESVRWLKQPEEDNYPAAQSYLSLVYDERTVREKVDALRRAPVVSFKSKDIFRASGCSLLGVSNKHVAKDQKRIHDGKELSRVRYAIGLVAAVVLGALIGLERQLRKHPAGFHTNALVALGAAAYVVAGTVVGDPTGPARVAGQVVVGVGFVCAGLIWHERGAVCAVGVFAGFGLLAWAVLILHTLEQRIGG